MKAKRTLPFEPDYAVLPGDTLRETMESLGMTQADLAMRTELTAVTLNRIFKGEQPISFETANRLEKVTGVPAEFWNALEAKYREQLTKLADRNRLKRDLSWLKQIPTGELAKRGAIEANTDKPALLQNVLKFYGVTSVSAWQEVWERPAVAARRSPCFKSQPGPASAWIRMGELQAQKRQCQPYNRASFLKTLKDIRALTFSAPDEFMHELIEKCAQCGVVLSLVPEFKKAPWNGATEWLTPDKAMILLSLRGKSEDKFWFSFFHEAGHVLHDSKKDLLINDGSKGDPREQRADTFASETLIPSSFHKRIIQADSTAVIRRLAEEIGIGPGIVAGRYGHLTGNWAIFRNLIKSFDNTAII